MTSRKLPLATLTAAIDRHDRRSAELQLARMFRPRPPLTRRLLARLTAKAARHYTLHPRLRRLERRPSGKFCAVALLA